MSKWRSVPRTAETAPVSAAPDIADELAKYQQGKHASLGAVLSVVSCEQAGDRDTNYSFTDVEGPAGVEEWVDEPDTSQTGAPNQPPGMLGRAAMAMLPAEIADRIAGSL